MRMRKVLVVFGVVLLLLGSVVAASILLEDPPKAGLCLAAGREASLGGVWLGLYRDSTFAFGQRESDISARGTYRWRSDTLLLTAEPGTTITCEQARHRFVLGPARLVELPVFAKRGCIGYLDVRRPTRELPKVK